MSLQWETVIRAVPRRGSQEWDPQRPSSAASHHLVLALPGPQSNSVPIGAFHYFPSGRLIRFSLHTSGDGELTTFRRRPFHTRSVLTVICLPRASTYQL